MLNPLGSAWGGTSQITPATTTGEQLDERGRVLRLGGRGGGLQCPSRSRIGTFACGMKSAVPLRRTRDGSGLNGAGPILFRAHAAPGVLSKLGVRRLETLHV